MNQSMNLKNNCYLLIGKNENWQDVISLPTKINLQTSKRKIDYELFNFLEAADKKWNTSISKLVNTVMEEN